jgi:sec-independent protein translocase protein TatA
MFGSLGLPELLVIFVIILIFFGPSRVPEIGKGLGEAIRGFKKGMRDDDEGGRS